MKRLVLMLIRGYQRFVSPLIGPVCRFEPTCSHYTSECVEHFGTVRGIWLGLRRIARCHPFNPGGYDPPPQLTEKTATPLDETAAKRAHRSGAVGHG